MPPGPDPLRARAAARRLEALRALSADAEDDVLASLVVTGEPAAQRVLDDWLDHVADGLRALGETADELRAVLAPFVRDEPAAHTHRADVDDPLARGAGR
ncbi:hypothetical protein [Phycicoccus avicenniae]|uniref:hypothetical protein n=1 Tax=Phycicoccus avicenniae TaxID=2828860 RepID=UPI003D283AAE